MVTRVLRRIALCSVNTALKGTHAFRIKATIMRLAGYAVGSGAKIVGPILISTQCDLKIGAESWIGASLTIHGNGSVEIGDRCDLGPGIVFLTGTHAVGDSNRRAGMGRNTRIVVKNGCWLGALSTYLGDLEVGDAAVIGAGSLVNKDIDPSSLWGGVPARRIRDLPPSPNNSSAPKAASSTHGCTSYKET